MKSRFDRPHENKNDCFDSSVLLFSRGSLFRRRPADGHREVERSQIDGDGKPVHSEWTGNFDGKDYSVTGDPIADTRSYTKVDVRT